MTPTAQSLFGLFWLSLLISVCVKFLHLIIVELGHVTCFGQWGVSGYDTTIAGKEPFCLVWSLAFLSLPREHILGSLWVSEELEAHGAAELIPKSEYKPS